MSFPLTSSLEMPVLQELVAVGGSDDLRFLYERLTAYFPQLTDDEKALIKQQKSNNWRKLVQRAGKELDNQGYLSRERGFWQITEKGRKYVENHNAEFEIAKPLEDKPAHTAIQNMLVEIGEILGFYTEAEFEYYDVVWREVPRASRLSHVFEVQRKGNIDSAFAKLKRAHEAQRSKIFLIIAGERDLKRAGKSLLQEFQDIENDLQILTFAQIQKTYQNIKSVGDIIIKFVES